MKMATAGRPKWRMVIALAFIGGAGARGLAAETGPAGDDPAVERRVQNLLTQLTPGEKIDLLSGTDWFFTHPVGRLGIPRLALSDGPIGVRNQGESTAYPAASALAASWDTALAEREGRSLGRDARARGDHFLLAPGVNIYRVPQNGRNFEFFGEDPFLAGYMAAGYVRGVQSQEVAACVKHFIANNQEADCQTADEIIGERAIHEIYLPAFEAAVRQGHVRSVMAAYNRVNGPYMTANRPLLVEVLRKQFGFDGVVMSDWGAVHDTLGAANGGVDLEMPSGIYFNQATLNPLLADGQVTQATIDEKVRRLLRVAVEMHWLDRPQKRTSIPLDDPQSNQTALQVAREGMVLLKNDEHLLPLDRDRVRRVVVIGPDAEGFVSGAGSSFTQPFHYVSDLDGIRAAAGGRVEVREIAYPTELDSEQRMSALAAASDFQQGLVASYFDNDEFKGEPFATGSPKSIDSVGGEPSAATRPSDRPTAVRWVGHLRPATTGFYLFAVRCPYGARVKLDGQTVIDAWYEVGTHTSTEVVPLQAGKPVELTVECYRHTPAPLRLQFGWAAMPEPLTAEQRSLVAGADAVIACVGTVDREGFDRPARLPADQEQLIAAACAANPRTVVVLHSGGGVEMSRWMSHTAALLDAWYAGQAGGQAVGEVLFGDVNPSGHLPDTFERTWADAPAHDSYPAQHGVYDYREGIFVGYRWFDAKRIEPQFCFGHGLSYTTFDVGNLRAAVDEETGTPRVAVSVDVTNTGRRSGAAVVQLYVHAPQGAVQRPVQELKGFARADLEPGERKTLKIMLDRRSFSYWDVNAHDWAAPPGQYELRAGLSSRDIRCTQTVDWN